MEEQAESQEVELNGADRLKLTTFWTAEIKRAQKRVQDWQSRGDEIVKRYRNEEKRVSTAGNGRFNVLWSNNNILKPMLYSRTPKTVVERRFKQKNELARIAGLALERSVELQIEMQDFDSTMKNCRDDYLLPGQGTAWVRYQPRIEMSEEGEDLRGEEVVVDYVFWKDYLSAPARTDAEVRWKARRNYMYKAEAVERFGPQAENLKYTHIPEGVESTSESVQGENETRQAILWEIWDKRTKKVYFVSPGCHEFLDVKPPPYKLHGFFPCPRPLTANGTTDTTLPVPFFLQYQDLAIQLDTLVGRSELLADALRVAGVYDENAEGVSAILSSGARNKLIPIKKFAINGEKLADAIVWLPMEQIANVLRATDDAIEVTLQRIYQITGMSDIIRGSTAPNETATAQQMKGDFATLRIADLQAEIQRFARDIIRIMAEIIAEVFNPQTIRAMAGDDIFPPPPQPMPQQPGQPMQPPPPDPFMQAIGLLKSDLLRTYVIDIETDSTIAIDEQKEKAEVNEFMAAFPQFAQTVDMLSQQPAFAPVMGEMLLACVRRFRFGRSLEGALDEAISQSRDMAQQQAQQAEQQGPQQDPAMMEMQGKMQMEGQKMQLQQQVEAQKLQLEQQKIQIAQQQEQRKLEVDFAKHRELMQADLQKAQIQAQTELEKLQVTKVLEGEKAQLAIAMKAAELQNTPDNKYTQDTIKAVTPEPANPSVNVIVGR